MSKMRIFRKILPWGGLYLAFVVAAIVLQRHVQSNCLREVWGWDYQTFCQQIGDWRWIGYFGFRHPGLGIVFSPLVMLQHVWAYAYLAVMPMIAVATAWLIGRIAGRVGLVIWLSFPATWLMAGIPESFPVAQLALVGSFHWLMHSHMISVRRGHRGAAFGIILFVVVNLLVTLTNGLKPALAYLAALSRTLDRRKFALVLSILAGLAALGTVLFCVRSLVTGRGIWSGVMATLSWIPDERNLPQELYGFFIRPVGVVQSALVYPFVVYGAYRLIRMGQMSILLLLLPYFGVDLAIHVLIGWGMAEPWVFAPHWIWILPMVAGLPNILHVKNRVELNA